MASPATARLRHDAGSAANLLAAHNFSAEAEQAYRSALQLWPGNPESVYGLAGVLAQSGRPDEARQVLADFTRKNPDQREAMERASTDFRILWTTQPPRP